MRIYIAGSDLRSIEWNDSPTRKGLTVRDYHDRAFFIPVGEVLGALSVPDWRVVKSGDLPSLRIASPFEREAYIVMVK